VGSLHEVGRYQLPETTSFQSGPIIADGVLFVTTATSTYAVNASNGKLLWSQKYQPKSLGLGTGVRGAAYVNGRLYRGTPDAHLIALDAKTGQVAWDVEAFDTAKGEYIAAAPIAWDGKLYIGNAGSDVGAIGHVRAFDLRDGRRLWSFDNVPATGPGADTWPADPGRVRAGGGMYSSFSLDPTDGSLYVPVGNPGPDFASDYRPGRNLYTSSVLRLDARTGALRGYHQFVEHDIHDWDIAASPILITSRAGRKMVVVGAKNGYLYAMDRDLSKIDGGASDKCRYPLLSRDPGRRQLVWTSLFAQAECGLCRLDRLVHTPQAFRVRGAPTRVRDAFPRLEQCIWRLRPQQSERLGVRRRCRQR
jgi:alcohol dehydrogenase (cytochrome c)